MRMRKAERDDIDALFALYRQLESPDKPLTLDRLRAAFADVERRGAFEVWVAEQEGRVVGTFMLAILEALGDRCRSVAIVEDVVVDRAHRSGGIGRQMMQFARNRAREAGCYKLMLSSNVAREDAHRFYESLGFLRHGYSFVVDV